MSEEKKKIVRITADSTLANADWVKAKVWDLPADINGFLNAIGGIDKLEHFMKLPAAKAMPEKLKEALKNYKPEN